MIFQNREEAGILLGNKLKEILTEEKNNLIVFGIPRGGVIVAKKAAEIIKAKLDIICPKKIPAPFNEEFAIGAVMPDGTYIIDEQSAKYSGADDEFIKKQIKIKAQEAQNKLEMFRNDDRYNIKDKICIIVDDGAATGHTIKVSAIWLEKQKPKDIIIAVPVISKEALENLTKKWKVIYLASPPDFQAVGQFYMDFNQVSDEEVISILK